VETIFSKSPVDNWSLFLIYIPYLFKFNGRLHRVVPILDLYLKHGADPSVCFIGYHQKKRNNSDCIDVQHPKETPSFYYTDLLTTLKMWGFEIPDGVQKLLGQRPRKYGGVLSSLKMAFQKFDHPMGQIKKLE
jgi:hypothetical protein